MGLFAICPAVTARNFHPPRRQGFLVQGWRQAHRAQYPLPVPAWHGDDSIRQLESGILEFREQAAVLNMTTMLSVFCLGQVGVTGLLLEDARQRYLRMRLDQRFSQLLRAAML